MLALVNALTLKKVFMNIFFTSFSLLVQEQQQAPATKKQEVKIQQQQKQNPSKPVETVFAPPLSIQSFSQHKS